MKKPRKVENQRAFRKWDAYVNNFKLMPNRQAVLLPMDIDIRDGRIYRQRMTGKAVKTYFNAARKKMIPDYMRAFTCATPTSTECLMPTMVDFPNIDRVIQHYVDNINDGTQAGGGLTPLDIETNRPTYMLFRIDHKDVKSPPTKYKKWRFSENKQITCHNDGVGPFLNVLPICTFDDGKALLVYNRHRSNPPTMKYDLHITIEQKVKDSNGKWMIAKTPIIIDPGLGNNGGDLP